MELFIPSLLLLLFTGVIVYGILPRFTITYVLALSVILLAYVLKVHYTSFADEYRYSTWQTIFTGYAPYMMLFFLIMFIIIAAVNIFTGRNGGSTPTSLIPTVSPLPSATTATNPITSALNTTIRTVSSGVSSAATGIANLGEGVVKSVNTALTGKSNSNRSYNLTSLVSTPR